MKGLARALAAIALTTLAVLTCQPALEPGLSTDDAPHTVVPVTTSTPVIPGDTPVRVQSPRQVLVVGDSEACAVSAYVRLVARDAGDAADVECRSSTTVQYWSSGRLARELDARPHVDTVVVFLGTNHYLDTSLPPVMPMLQQLESRGLTCVWVGNTLVKGRHRKINLLLREAVSPTCTYFDTEAFGVELRDGVHPTPAAAERWIRAVWSTIPVRYEDVE